MHLLKDYTNEGIKQNQQTMPPHHKEVCTRLVNTQDSSSMMAHTVVIRREKPQVKHPLTNTPIVLSKIQDTGLTDSSSQGSQGSFYDKCWRNVLAFRWMSISGGSKTTYQSGWNKWKPFTEEFGTNLTLTIIPPEWTLSPIPSLTFSECAITAYMAYLQDKNLLPKTIFTYVFGVLFFLKNMNIDITPITISKFVKSIKSGISRSYRLNDNDLHCEANKKRTLPLSVFMLVEIRTRIITPGSKAHLCLCCAIHAAFVYLFRSCEFLMIRDSDQYYHYLREQDVRFAILDESGIEHNIPSSEAHLYASRFRSNKHSLLVDVQTNVRHAKNDPEGFGNRFIHEIEKPGENRAFCIASMMFECAMICKPIRNWPFFSLPQEKKVLSEKDVEWAIKESAKRFFTPDLVKRFTNRSCRVGGATALWNAGAPDSYIKSAGRWKSDAFLIYLRASVRLCQQQTATMCQLDSGFTAEYISKQYSRVHLLDNM